MGIRSACAWQHRNSSQCGSTPYSTSLGAYLPTYQYDCIAALCRHWSRRELLPERHVRMYIPRTSTRERGLAEAITSIRLFINHAPLRTFLTPAKSGGVMALAVLHRRASYLRKWVNTDRVLNHARYPRSLPTCLPRPDPALSGRDRKFSSFLDHGSPPLTLYLTLCHNGIN